ncbi:MAG: PD40 domain-containing protein [Planctomycetes bacterium]|nr:PD40 domain-containing protein [Planctomycetota bacterium]
MSIRSSRSALAAAAVLVLVAVGLPAQKKGGGGSTPPADPAIAFAEAGIKVMNADGSNVRTVVALRRGEGAWFPSWSPDGTQLVFTANLGGQRGVYKIGLDGSPPQFLTPVSGIMGSYVDWSRVPAPDGPVQDRVPRRRRGRCGRRVRRQHRRHRPAEPDQLPGVGAVRDLDAGRDGSLDRGRCSERRRPPPTARALVRRRHRRDAGAGDAGRVVLLRLPGRPHHGPDPVPRRGQLPRVGHPRPRSDRAALGADAGLRRQPGPGCAELLARRPPDRAASPRQQPERRHLHGEPRWQRRRAHPQQRRLAALEAQLKRSGSGVAGPPRRSWRRAMSTQEERAVTKSTMASEATDRGWRLTGVIVRVVLLSVAVPAVAQSTWVQAPLSYTGGYYQAAYDGARGRTVLLNSSGTWEWDGDHWLAMHPTVQPDGRLIRARDRTVTFGSRGIWEWDGIDWTLQPTSGSPPDGEVAYDSTRQRVVLFKRDWSRSETWEWDGARWVYLTPTTQPPPRTEFAFAYDAARQRVVLFGGVANGSGPIYLNDTWEWDGTNWALRAPSTRPTVRAGARLAYDPARQRAVLFGGHGLPGVIYAETWEWDGANWNRRTPVNSPSARSDQAMTYDVGRQRVVLFGGVNYTTGPSTDTWEWDGTNWTQRAPNHGPAVMYSHAMTPDSGRQRVLLFGGSWSLGFFADTWEWDGFRWRRRTPAQAPSPRGGHAMADDAARQRVVLFGGRVGGGSPLADTWEWDGTNWIRRAPTQSPSGREAHAMVYDAARQRVVMFGGYAASARPVYYADTWEWDGGNWIYRSSTRRPIGRADHAMAYDAARQRVVLFGGYIASSNTDSAETWEWDGTDWTQLHPAHSPPGRSGHAMAYDALRQRVVMCGGQNRNSGFLDTWEWDGVDWRPSQAISLFSGLHGHRMAYDATRQNVVLVGRYLTALFTATPATAKAFGSGCTGDDAPVLTSTRPQLGGPALSVDLHRARPRAPCLFGFSLGAQNQPVGGGCTLYLQSPIETVAAVANAAGFASCSVSVPDDIALRGLSLFLQAFAVDPQGPAFGLTFSNGVGLLVGD